MYGLPKTFDGQFFVGHTLEQICFTQNQVVLHFDSEIAITIESAFSHRRNQISERFEIPLARSELMQLLGRPVTKVICEAGGTLTLDFSNDHSLSCFDTSSQFESYHIKNRKEVITV